MASFQAADHTDGTVKGDENSKSGNPLYSDAENGVLDILGGSPCVNSAQPITGITTDINNEQRAETPSIGAREGKAYSKTKYLLLDVKTTKANDSTSGTAKIEVMNGTPPYKYTWINPEIPSKEEILSTLINNYPDIDSVAVKVIIDSMDYSYKNDLTAGEYMVCVEDAQNKKMCLEFDINSELEFGTKTGVVIEGDNIKKTANDGWGNAIAITKGLFKVGSEGKVIFSIKNDINSKHILGLKRKSTTINSGYQDIVYGYYIENGIVNIIENGEITMPNIDTIVIGDKISIEIIDTIIRYQTDYALIIDRAFYLGEYEASVETYDKGVVVDAWARVKLVGIELLAIENRVIVATAPRLIVTDASCPISNSGQILFDKGTYYSYASSFCENEIYEWKNTSTDDIIPNDKYAKNLYAGTYNLTYSYDNCDNINPNIISYNSIVVANKISWMESKDVLINNNSIKKTTTSGSYDAGASSLNNFKGGENAWVEFEYRYIINNSGLKIGFVNKNISETDFTLNNGMEINCVRIQNQNFYFIKIGETICKVINSNTVNKFKISINGNSESFYYINNSGNPIYIGTVDNLINNGDKYVLRALLKKNNSEVFNVRSSFDCGYNIHESYGLLKKTIDGGYYTVLDNKLKFKYTSEYANNSGANLVCKIKNVKLGPEVTINSEDIIYGEGYYTINVSGLGLNTNNFYILEVQNAKNEKFYLRFKY